MWTVVVTNAAHQLPDDTMPRDGELQRYGEDHEDVVDSVIHRFDRHRQPFEYD